MDAFAADMDDVVFDFAAAEGPGFALGLVAANGVGGHQHVARVEQGLEDVDPGLVLIVMEGEGHDAAIFQTAACLGPAGRQGLAVKVAGGLRPVERIRVLLRQGAIAGEFLDAGQILRLNEGLFFVILPVIGMLYRVVHCLHTVGRALRFKVGRFGQALVPFAQGQAQPDIEEVGQVGIKKIIPERRICDHQIELFIT